jgi:hypothetical protein
VETTASEDGVKREALKTERAAQLRVAQKFFPCEGKGRLPDWLSVVKRYLPSVTLAPVVWTQRESNSRHFLRKGACYHYTMSPQCNLTRISQLPKWYESTIAARAAM